MKQALEVKIEMLERLLEGQKRSADDQLSQLRETLESERRMNSLLVDQLNKNPQVEPKVFWKSLFS